MIAEIAVYITAVLISFEPLRRLSESMPKALRMGGMTFSILLVLLVVAEVLIGFVYLCCLLFYIIVVDVNVATTAGSPWQAVSTIDLFDRVLLLLRRIIYGVVFATGNTFPL